MEELTLLDTNGILRQPGVRPERTSAGLGWDRGTSRLNATAAVDRSGRAFRAGMTARTCRNRHHRTSDNRGHRFRTM
jgi:hypothetical protein